MNKPKISLKHLNYLYLLINLLSYSIILGIILFVLNDCYHLYLKESSLFEQSKSITNSNVHLDKFLQTTLLGFIFGLLKILMTIIIVSLVKFGLFRIPISHRYLIALDKNNQISSILGRYLSYHFRRCTSLHFKTLVYFNQEAEYEKYILEQHFKKNKFSYFLEKYDSDYKNDLK